MRDLLNRLIERNAVLCRLRAISFDYAFHEKLTRTVREAWRNSAHP